MDRRTLGYIILHVWITLFGKNVTVCHKAVGAEIVTVM